MTESFTSIRLLFVFFGLGLILNGIDLYLFAAYDWASIHTIGLFTAIIGFTYIIHALHIRKNLSEGRSKPSLTMLRIGIMLVIATAVGNVFSENTSVAGGAISLVFAIAILWHMRRSVRKLADQN